MKNKISIVDLTFVFQASKCELVFCVQF